MPSRAITCHHMMGLTQGAVAACRYELMCRGRSEPAGREPCSPCRAAFGQFGPCGRGRNASSAAAHFGIPAHAFMPVRMLVREVFFLS